MAATENFHKTSPKHKKLSVIPTEFYKFSSGSRNFRGGRPTNMKSMPPLVVAIFFMTTFYRPRGGPWPPWPPPGSATESLAAGCLPNMCEVSCWI